MAAFQQTRTLAVHLALVQAEAKLGEGDVHLRAGTLLFWVKKGVGGWAEGKQGAEHVSTTRPPTWIHKQESCLPKWILGAGVDLRGPWEITCNLPSFCCLPEWFGIIGP